MKHFQLLCSCLLLLLFSTNTLFAQETPEQYEHRLAAMQAEEAKISEFVQANMLKDIPQEQLDYFNYIIEHHDELHEEGEAHEINEAQELEGFKASYWRNQYFNLNPNTIQAYQSGVVTASCDNGDFELGTFANYDPFRSSQPGIGYEFGNCNLFTATITPPVSIINFTPGNFAVVEDFEIMDAMTGMIVNLDPYTNVPLVNNGDHSARLNSDMDDPGDNRPERSVSRIMRTVVLSGNNETIYFSYAPVLQNPDFHDNQQPTFIARVLDLDSNECDRLCENPEMAGNFLQVAPNDAGVRFKPWQCGSLVACGDSGDTVLLEFNATDCGQGAHWGYVYLDDICDTCMTTSDSCNFEGSIELNPTDTCDTLAMQVCGTFQLAIQNCTTGVVDDIRLQIQQNGANVTVGTIPFTITGNTFCFTVDASNFPSGVSPGDGFDFFVEIDFDINGVINTKNDYHSNPGPNNDYVWEADCCPEFFLFNCCDLTSGVGTFTTMPSLALAKNAQDNKVLEAIERYNEAISLKSASFGSEGYETDCCDYCQFPDDPFPLFIFDEFGMLVDNSVYTITWSNDPLNNSAIGWILPDVPVTVTVAGPDDCVWTFDYLLDCCDEPGYEGICCDTIDFEIDLDSLCNFDPCDLPTAPFPVQVSRDGSVIGTPAYSFLWSNGSTGSATSATLLTLPLSVTVTDLETGCIAIGTYDINCDDPCEVTAPTNLYCVEHKGNTTIYWTPVPGATSYQVEFVYNSGKCCGIGQIGLGYMVNTTDPWHVISGTPCFAYRVRAICSKPGSFPVSYGPWSDWSCSKCFATVIDDKLKFAGEDQDQDGNNLEVTAAPNPTSERVTISVQDHNELIPNGSATLRITDIFGREIHRSIIATNSDNQLDVSQFSQGIYIYTILSEGVPLFSDKLVIE